LEGVVMIVRATSDLHLRADTERWVFQALDVLEADARENPGYTVICGDVFDQGMTAHMPTWNRLCAKLRFWPDKVFVLVGNHDQYKAPHNILEGMMGGSCVVVSVPMWTPIGRMLPYTEPHEFRSLLDAMEGDATAPPVIWCHHGFKGAYVNSNRRDKDGVEHAAIPPGHVVISGHYHMPQNLASLIYCGSPYEITFHEEGQKKGWLRWENIHENRIPDRIAYDLDAPRHFTVHWEPASGPPTPPEGARPQDKVRVKTLATRKEADAASDQLDAVGLRAVSVHAQPDQAGRGVVDASLGVVEAAQQYAEHKFIGEVIGPEPEDMDEWAEKVELWADL
jgi:DNA repair exonuclease SbcCD nuclease subunit